MKSKRWIIIISFTLIILAIPISGLLYTEQGLNLVIQIVSQNIPGKLKFDSIKGSLSSDIEIENLHYQDTDIEVDITHGKIKWQPWKLTSTLLHFDTITLDGVNIRTQSSTAAKSTDSEPVQLPDIILPFRFLLRDIVIKDFHFYTNNVEALHLINFQLAAKSQFGSINISSLIAETDDFNLNLSGKVKPRGNYGVDASGRFQIKELFAKPLTINAILSGDLKQLKTTANITGFVEGSVNGTLYDVLNNLHWDAGAKVNALGLNSFSADLPGNNISGEFQSSGSIDNFKFVGNAATEYAEWGDISASYDAAIVGSELVIQDLQLQEKNHSAQINSQGSINWSGDDVVYNLAGRWQEVYWPWKETETETEAPAYKSPSGKLIFSGKVSDYKLAVDTELEGAGTEGFNLPFSHLVADANGDLQKLNISAFQIETMDGELTGKSSLNWEKEFRWDADIKLSQINPETIAKDFPGSINAEIKTNGSVSDNLLAAGLVVKNIDGKLNNKPLSGSANINLKNNDINIEHLDLKLNGTELALKGDLTKQNNLQYKLVSNDLSGIFPEVHGKLSAVGTIIGQRDTPQLVLNLNAKNLEYDKYSVTLLTTTADISMDPKQNLKFDLTAGNLVIDTNKIDSMQVNANGSLPQHEILLKLRQQKDTVEFKAGGGLIDKTWRGDIFDSLIKTASMGDWRLEKSSRLTIAENTLDLEKNCYVQQQTDFCFNAKYKDARLNAGFEWKHLAIERFRHWLPPEITINSMLNGSATLEYENEKLNASVKAINTTGDFTAALETGDKTINFDQGHILLDWNPQQRKSTINLPLGDKAKLKAAIIIDQQNKSLTLQQQPLKGNVTLQLPSLIFFESFIPALRNLDQAHAEAKLQISGSLMQPVFIGNASAGAAKLLIPDLNVTLNNTNLNVLIDKKQFVNFSLETGSGKGLIKITGDAKYSSEKTWGGHANIQGDEFLAIDLPEATVQISPKLVLQLEKNKISIDGDVTVPYARLHPKKLPTGTISESTDLVIVGKEQKVAADDSRWETTTRVRLILGDRVSFDGFGLRSKLAGSLQLIDSPGEVTVGRGEINLIDGFYRSFGQELQISKGRFLFANSPIDDPGLDIRAQRVAGDVTAGVNVTSTLRKPEVRLFSEPIMGESDALSYLLLGRPVKQINQSEGSQLMTAATAMGLAGSELLARTIGNRLGIEEVLIQTDTDSGASSLVIGRYLSPKLYIRYFTGIFERSNIVQLRYNVTNKVIIQTETGSQMGADIFYTIEK